MRVLFDITHPLHVHLFGATMQSLAADGHAVLAAAREKDVAMDLLVRTGVPYEVLSVRRRGFGSLAAEWFVRNARMLALVRRFRPDVLVAEVGVTIGPAGAICRVPRVVFDQADSAQLQRRMGLTFATVVCTGDGYRGNFGQRHMRFRGVLSQAYLAPGRFAPDANIVRRAGVDPDQPYAVLRLVSWQANHDLGRRGPSVELLQQAVERLSRQARVYISAEGLLPAALEPYRNPLGAADFLHLLAGASVCIAEGGSVGVEAALLGVPAITCNSYEFGYLQAMLQRGLLLAAANHTEAVAMAEDILANSASRQTWQGKLDEFYADTDDVAALIRRVICNVAAGRAAADGETRA